MRKLSYYLELAARWHVFIFLNIYGWGKIFGGQFFRKGNLPVEIAQQTLDQVSGFNLAWTFMGYSYTYILFIGISQIIGAWCLLWNRTKLLGILILIPILVNIIVFDAIFLETYGALASAVTYFSLLMIVLYFNRDKVIEVLKIITQKGKDIHVPIGDKINTAGIILVCIAVIFGFEQLMINLLGH